MQILMTRKPPPEIIQSSPQKLLILNENLIFNKTRLPKPK